MEKFKFHSEPSKPELKMRVILDAMGLKYSYQLPTRSGYVLDFAFRHEKKALEIDGYFHQFRREKDVVRDRVLRLAGWSILRIPANEVEKEITQAKIRTFLR